MSGQAGSGRAADCIVLVDVVRCALPLERAVHIGRTVYREREYVALRLMTADGTEGHAIGYTRGLPLDAMVGLVARDLRGTRLDDRAAVMEGLQARHVNAAGALGRAFSLVDIALADLEARRAGQPLWRLLGGARTRVPLMVVAGYHAAERGAEAVVAEVQGLVDAGFGHIKLHTIDLPLVARIRSRLPDGVGLAVDAGMAWRTIDASLEACRPLDDLGLAFIEDPFPPQRWRLTAELAGRLRTPVAAGEDAPDPWLLTELAGVVGLLRVDATVSGGYSGVLAAAEVAAARGVPVMTHAFPDQHAHLAGAAAVGMVEMIPDASGVNPVGQLLARRQVIEAGELILSDEPGHGAPLDWGAVERVARHQQSLTIEAAEEAACS